MKRNYSSGPFVNSALVASIGSVDATKMPGIDLYYVHASLALAGLGIRYGEPDCCTLVLPLAIILEVIASRVDADNTCPPNTGHMLRCLGLILNPGNVLTQTIESVTKTVRTLNARN